VKEGALSDEMAADVEIEGMCHAVCSRHQQLSQHCLYSSVGDYTFYNRLA